MAQVRLWLFPLITSTLMMMTDAAPPLPPAAAAMEGGGREPSCLRKCGEVDVPYPFGIGDDDCCSWGGEFSLTCDDTFDPPKLLYNNGTAVQVLNISLEAGEVRVSSPVSYMCYNSSTTLAFGGAARRLDVSGSPFLLSRARNVFTAIGCSMVAWLDAGEGAAGDDDDVSYFTGCVTYCAGSHEAAEDGEPCTGLGCCQTSLPGNLSSIVVKTTDSSHPPNNPAWES